jgi:non-heme chloroperoxidase
MLLHSLIVVAALLVVVLGVALYQIASPPPRIGQQRDIFGFEGLGRKQPPKDLPELLTYGARDGEQLAYRFYDSAAERILVFVHGSSYHGAGYHTLARTLSQRGVAKVVTPNLRGHYLSGRRRGDVEYIGQLEDDLRDLIDLLRSQGQGGAITLGGHSSGGGLVIRFAGGGHAGGVASYLLLSPVIPTSPAVREGTAGGWASLHGRRLFGLLVLNAVGIHGFDGLSIIEFNKPRQYWDGTETLSYSYRLNTSYHPRYDYQADIRTLQEKALLVLVGDRDEAVDAEALAALFASDVTNTTIEVLPGVGHFALFADDAALAAIADWLRRQ